MIAAWGQGAGRSITEAHQAVLPLLNTDGSGEDDLAGEFQLLEVYTPEDRCALNGTADTRCIAYGERVDSSLGESVDDAILDFQGALAALELDWPNDTMIDGDL